MAHYTCVRFCGFIAYRNMRVAGIALGVRCGEDSVHQHERSDNLSSKSSAKAVARVNEICAATVVFVE